MHSQKLQDAIAVTARTAVLLGMASAQGGCSRIVHADTVEPIPLQKVYSSALPTRFISAQDWPPSIQASTAPFVCTEDSAALPVSKLKTIGERTYCVAMQSEGAVGSVYTSYRYVTALAGQPGSVVVTFTLRYPQCANYDNLDKAACLQERESFSVDRMVDDIVRMLRVAPGAASEG